MKFADLPTDLPADLPAIAGQLMGHFVAFNSLRYLIAAGAMAAIVGLMRWRGSRRRIQARAPGMSDYRRELLTSLRTAVIFSAVGVLSVWGQRIGVMTADLEAASGWAIVGFVIALLLWHDTWFYWTHRAMHDRRVFPWMHRTHHRSVAPTPFAAYAFSVSEALVQAAFLPLWLLFIPTPLAATFIVMIIMITRNVMGHAGEELHPRGWVDHPILQWINTTVHHDLHHSGGFGSNYGLYFTWWDRICGTEHPEYRARFRALTEPSGASERVPEGASA